MVVKRNRTPSKYVGYGLYLYFLGLSYRNTSKALSRFVKRSHVFIWKWIQKYRPKRIMRKRKRTMEFIIDETMIKIGSNYMWIWIAIESESKEILGMCIKRTKYTHCRALYFFIDKRILW
jgi:putative transposase